MELSKKKTKKDERRLRIEKYASPADWLRSFKGCEHYSDEEAKQVIASLDVLADVLIEVAQRNTAHIDNQHVVPLYEENETKKIAA